MTIKGNKHKVLFRAETEEDEFLLTKLLDAVGEPSSQPATDHVVPAPGACKLEVAQIIIKVDSMRVAITA